MVSVIIPVYKTDLNKLKQCLDSMLAQTLNNIEFLVVFDGDNKKQIDFCKSNYNSEKFKFISCQHLGVSHARNVGIKKAVGEYIMFCDSDDWYSKDICNKAYIAAKEYDADMMVWDYICEIGEKHVENVLYTDDLIIKENKEKDVFYFGNICRKLDKGLNRKLLFGAGGIWNKAYKRDYLISNNVLFPENCQISEDIIFNLYAVKAARRIGYFHSLGYHYRIETGSTSFCYDENIFEKNQVYFRNLEVFIDDIKEPNIRSLFCNIKNNVIVNSFVRSVEQLRKACDIKDYQINNCQKLCYENYKCSLYQDAINDALLKYSTLKQQVCLILLKLRLYSIFLKVVDLKNKRKA